MASMQGLHVVIVPAWWPSVRDPIAGIFFEDYARAFAAAGAQVGVIVPELVGLRHGWRQRAALRPRIVHETMDDIPVTRVTGLHTALGSPERRMHGFRHWLMRGLNAYQQRIGRPSVLHAMCAIPSGWACTQLSGEDRLPVVITEHTGPFSLVLSKKTGERFVRGALAAAEQVVAVSAPLQEDMHAAGIDREIEVIANPVSKQIVAHPAPKPLTYKDGRRRIDLLFIGRLTEEKGIRELVAAALLLKDDPNFAICWQFAGKGPLKSWIGKQFQTAGYADQVTLHGHCNRSKIAELLKNSHALVLPSHWENCPLAICEALTAGRPVVVSDAPGCAALMAEGDGLVVTQPKSQEYVHALLKLLHEYDQWNGQAIAKRAQARFSYSIIAQRYAELFQRVTR